MSFSIPFAPSRINERFNELYKSNAKNPAKIVGQALSKAISSGSLTPDEECAAVGQFEDILAKGRKALPDGTTRVYGGKEYVKQGKKWVPKAKANTSSSSSDEIKSTKNSSFKTKEELSQMSELEISKYSNDLRLKRNNSSGDVKKEYQEQIDLADSFRSFSKRKTGNKALDTFLDKFKDDETSWKGATDELLDLSRDSREYLKEYQNIVVNAVNKKNLSTPSEWNKKLKESIRSNFSKMDSDTKKRFLEKNNSFLSSKELVKKQRLSPLVKEDLMAIPKHKYSNKKEFISYAKENDETGVLEYISDEALGDFYNEFLNTSSSKEPEYSVGKKVAFIGMGQALSGKITGKYKTKSGETRYSIKVTSGHKSGNEYGNIKPSDIANSPIQKSFNKLKEPILLGNSPFNSESVDNVIMTGDRDVLAKSLSYALGSTKVSKKGSELKTALKERIALIKNTISALEIKAEALKTKAGIEPSEDVYLSTDEKLYMPKLKQYPYRVYESYHDSNTITLNNEVDANKTKEDACKEYNECIYSLRSCLRDVHEGESYIDVIEDDKKYDLSIRDLVDIGFNSSHSLKKAFGIDELSVDKLEKSIKKAASLSLLKGGKSSPIGIIKIQENGVKEMKIQ